MPAFWIELSLSNQHVPGSHAEHGLLLEKKGASPERGAIRSVVKRTRPHVNCRVCGIESQYSGPTTT